MDQKVMLSVPSPSADIKFNNSSSSQSTPLLSEESSYIKETDPEKTKNEQNPMQKLEDALVHCKFGIFNMRLLFASMAAIMATTIVTTTSSYMLSIAECDLDMSIMQKGLLNAMPFVGQIIASFFTGFFTDAFGRRVSLVGGLFAIFICTVLEASSQNYYTIIFWKAIEGIFLSIAYSGVSVMVTEFTHKHIRDKVLLLVACFMSISLIIAALMSWGLLINKWDFIIIDGYFELHTWNIYLYVCSIWSLLGAMSYYFLPESPKFLLSIGQENEALEILKNVFKENTGQAKENFPISSLSVTGSYKPTTKMGLKKQFTNALSEAQYLFRKPLLGYLILFCTTTFVSLLAYSCLRLWYPQLSTIIENYEMKYGNTDQFCVMITDYTSHLVINVTEVNDNQTTCVPQLSGSKTYINSVIFGFVSLICIGTSATLVNHMGQKPLMYILFLACAGASGSLYWTNSSIQIAILVSATCGFVQAALSLQQSILVRVFPTSVRTLAFSLVMMTGRIGSLAGNVLFPVLLQAGCMGPFVTLSVISICVTVVTYFLPNPRKDGSSGDK